MMYDGDGHFAVVIPAYNEAATIADVAARSLTYCDRVIVVNDASSDDTAEQLESLPVTVINNTTNQGKGRSIRKGAEYALGEGAESVITLDGDGQHCPEDIPLLIEKSLTCPNRIIIAARLRVPKNAPALRRFANRFADFWISWAAGQRIRDSQSGFRLYPARVFQDCQTTSNGFVFESEVLIDASRLGITSTDVVTDALYHDNGRTSHYRPVTDTLAIVHMVAFKLLAKGMHPLGFIRALGLAGSDPTKTKK